MLADEPISKIMTTPVTTASKIAPFSIIKQIFQQQAFHHVPIIHENKVIGMITSTDIIKAGHLEDLNSHDPQVDTILDHAVLIENLMQKNPLTIRSHASIREAADVFIQHHFHALPVVNQNDELVGIVTTKDVIRYLLGK